MLFSLKSNPNIAKLYQINEVIADTYYILRKGENNKVIEQLEILYDLSINMSTICDIEMCPPTITRALDEITEMFKRYTKATVVKHDKIRQTLQQLHQLSKDIESFINDPKFFRSREAIIEYGSETLGFVTRIWKIFRQKFTDIIDAVEPATGRCLVCVKTHYQNARVFMSRIATSLRAARLAFINDL